ncbi:MAG: hypothetical protein ACO3ND_05590 [Opitutales bacterium]
MSPSTSTPRTGRRCLATSIASSAPPARAAADLGIPTVPGTDHVKSAAEALQFGSTAGYPFLLKASAGGGGPEAYAAAYDFRVRRAVEWARAIGAERFVFTSSTGVYRQDGGVTVDEDSPAGGDLASDAILAGEAAAAGSGIAFTRALRFGGLYGPGRHYLLDAFRRGETVVGGRSDHLINYLHGDDAASSVIAALEGGPPGHRTYNVTDGRPVTKAELARWIALRLGLPPPAFVPEAEAGPRMRKGGRTQPSRRVDASKIAAELGWKPLYADVYAGLGPCLPGGAVTGP